MDLWQPAWIQGRLGVPEFLQPTQKWKTSWWLNHPSQKYAQVKFDSISPGIGVKIKKQLKPPPRTGFLGGKALVSNSDCLSSNRWFGKGKGVKSMVVSGSHKRW